MSDWQRIETAPRDGTIIWLANRNIMRLGWWTSNRGYENHGTVGGGWIDKGLAEAGGVRGLTFAPTHWQPTPESCPSD